MERKKNCCGEKVRICKRCEEPFCKHTSSSQSYFLCWDCVNELVEEYLKENNK